MSDGDGLYLLVKPNGSKLWQWPYRHAGKANIHSIGDFSEVGIADARAARDQGSAWLRAGLDPNIEKRAARARNTERQQRNFAWLADEWFAKESDTWSPKHKAARRSQLDKDLLPAIGAIPIADVTPTVALAALQRIEARGALEMASKARILGSLISLWDRARVPDDGPVRASECGSEIAKGSASRDDCASRCRGTIRRTRGRARRIEHEARALLAHPDRMPHCGDALRDLGRDTRRTMARPAARMKMRLEHVVPLSDQARRILELAKPLRQSDDASALLFPGFTRYGALSENALLALLARAGYFGRQTGMDSAPCFRHGRTRNAKPIPMSSRRVWRTSRMECAASTTAQRTCLAGTNCCSRGLTSAARGECGCHEAKR